MEKFFIKADDNYSLSLNIYERENPIGIVQVAHGMQEHKERYDEFAKFLSKKGFIVVTADMRGHGENTDKLGFFKHKDGYKFLVKDQVLIANFIKEKYPNLPLNLFAHSMGTIISRVVLQKHSKLYNKVVLSGYPCYQQGTGFGVFLANLVSIFKGNEGYSKLLDKIVVGNFNKAIKNPQTAVDWISYNQENVKKYLEDPLCGFNFTISAFRDLMNLVKLMHNYKNYVDIKKDLSILLLRGEDDPCVGGIKGAEDSKKVLIKAGFKNIQDISYPLMRHEILNEKDHLQIYQDTLDFLTR